MGEIVAAIGTCHTPYMFTRPPDENPKQLEQAGAAMNELGKVLDETKPDAIIFLGADHVETFSVTCVPAFAIIAGNVAMARFAGREHNLPIHREMAEDILNKLVVDHNFDIAYSEDAELGHAFSDPVRVRDREARHPGDPVLHQRLRAAAADAAALRGAGQGAGGNHQGPQGKVAIIASGGMSHFPGTTKYLHPEFDFDRWLVSQWEAGNTDALLNMTGTQLDEVGNTELLSWAVMFGAIGKHEGELIDYIPTWHHGLCMMRFLPHRKRTTAADAGGRAVRRVQVQEPGVPVLQAPAVGGLRPEQAAVRVAPQRRPAQPHRERLREGGRRVRPARRAANGGALDDQRRQGGPGQRARGPAGRGRRAPATGADVAARDLLHDA